jgi:hypothetical protein
VAAQHSLNTPNQNGLLEMQFDLTVTYHANFDPTGYYLLIGGSWAATTGRFEHYPHPYMDALIPAAKDARNAGEPLAAPNAAKMTPFIQDQYSPTEVLRNVPGQMVTVNEFNRECYIRGVFLDGIQINSSSQAQANVRVSHIWKDRLTQSGQHKQMNNVSAASRTDTNLLSAFTNTNLYLNHTSGIAIPILRPAAGNSNTLQIGLYLSSENNIQTYVSFMKGANVQGDGRGGGFAFQ